MPRYWLLVFVRSSEMRRYWLLVSACYQKCIVTNCRFLCVIRNASLLLLVFMRSSEMPRYWLGFCVFVRNATLLTVCFCVLIRNASLPTVGFCVLIRNVLLTVDVSVSCSEMPRGMRSCRWCQTNPTMWTPELSLTSLVVTTNLTRSVTCLQQSPYFLPCLLTSLPNFCRSGASFYR